MRVYTKRVVHIQHIRSPSSKLKAFKMPTSACKFALDFMSCILAFIHFVEGTDNKCESNDDEFEIEHATATSYSSYAILEKYEEEP